MREWKAKKTLHAGNVYYDVASAARLLRTTAIKVQHLMSNGELEWTQIRVGGRLLVHAESIIAYKRAMAKAK